MSWKSAAVALIVAVSLIVSLYRAKDGARDSRQEIHRLEAEIAQALEKKALLGVELAHKSRREWLEAYAREELGMAPAHASQFVDLAELEHILGPADAMPEARQGDPRP